MTTSNCVSCGGEFKEIKNQSASICPECDKAFASYERQVHDDEQQYMHLVRESHEG